MLHRMRQDPKIEIYGLSCIINVELDRVTMHVVHVISQRTLAENVSLPVQLISHFVQSVAPQTSSPAR